MVIDLTLGKIGNEIYTGQDLFVLSQKSHERVNDNLRIISSSKAILEYWWLNNWFSWKSNSTFFRIENSKVSIFLNNFIFVINEVSNSGIKFFNKSVKLFLILSITFLLLGLSSIFIGLTDRTINLVDIRDNLTHLISSVSSLRKDIRDHHKTDKEVSHYNLYKIKNVFFI
jgi:hypothetical protein